MKKFFQKFGKRISNLVARGIKNFGYISIGISICALIEIGTYWELIGLTVLSLAVTALSYVMIKKTEEALNIGCEENEEGEC